MERPVPFDLDAERALLGACLIEREAILAVRNLVASAEFYLEKNALIYDAMLDCVDAKIPPDLTTVVAQLREKDHLDIVGGLFYLSELANATPTAVHAPHYARIVRRMAQRRRLIELGGQISAAGYDTTRDPDDLVSEFEQLLELERKSAASAEDWQGHMEDGRDIWRMQFTPRPFIIEELLPAGVTLMHGLPKTRKSWLAMNLCYAVASGGRALGHLVAQQGEALYLNLEMDRELLNERLRVMFPDSEPPPRVKFFYEWPLMNAGLFSRLENYLSSRPYTRLIVVDTLVRVLPDVDGREGYRSDSRMLEAWTKFNANRGLAILLIHHSRKAGGGGDPIISLSGSTGYGGSVDSALELELPDQNNLSVGRINRRGRRLRDDSPLKLKWDVQIGSWSIDKRSNEITPERRAVLRVVEERGPITPSKLAIVLNRPAPSIRRICQEMQAAGQLANVGGAYAMPYDESQIA
jgi:hypothetical protein